MTEQDSEIQGILEGKLDQHAQALGYLCLFWSRIETTLNLLIGVIARLDDAEIRASILHNVDVREKIQILLAIGFAKRPSDEWFADLKRVLNLIDNELRVERNRMIHDEWDATPEMMLRTTKLARVVYEQARQLILKTEEKRSFSVQQIKELVIRLRDAIDALIDLMTQFALSRMPQESSPEKSD